jgi:uncharacterized damage-inducible protein DinB
MSDMSEEVRYPIGKFIPQSFSQQLFQQNLIYLRDLPLMLEYAITNLDESRLETPYREGGWTVKQLVHHVADSHMNAFIRCKLALTEDKPVIKPYDQDAWVLTTDVNAVPVNVSITLLHSLHIRWYHLLKGLSEADLQRSIVHPEYKREMSVWFLLDLYAWHGRHHTAHITSLRERMGW